ncbi:Chromosomal replication initiator DnaA [Parvibaculum lavamentivorans DS-1]|uniref:Chromosomal replication initiator DnaA n=1 Tax=Parvibaculum lavamentivorans (strain DS-1 / DSM 13023 / NCIMB 13966) TaxID=402881 RepID=A7HYE9_PARL1|nr:DnaA/Hda family protein [Parvibaculum lavamentivorans]ABS64932.1 Chromosomal replication initiator DnaA [Parvibaculum lavamentivorans DS-1]
MPRQLAFELGHRPAFGREDFLVAPPNEAAVALIDAWPDWPDRVVALSGPEGSGKTHLAEVWRNAAGAVSLAPSALAGADVPALVAARTIILEDLAAPDAAAERALFHLVNLVREEGAFLLITARVPLSRLPLALPDLASRLKAVPQAELGPPDDALLAGILVKLFDDRQLRVAPAVIAWLAARIERSVRAARDAVAELDRASLSGKRPITVPLAAEILGTQDEMKF